MKVHFAVCIPVVVENHVLEILFRVVPGLAVNILVGQNVQKSCDTCNSLGYLEMAVGKGHKVRCKLQT